MRHAATLALALLLPLFPAAAADKSPGEKVFRAGAATSNITPFLGTDLIGGFNPRAALRIHDELHARCLALDDGATRIAIVLVDNVKFPTEVHGPTKELIRETTGLPPENVLIAGTHTHSAPSLRGKSYLVLDEPLDDYQKFVIRRVSDGVRRAIQQLEPARIGWGTGELPQHVFNRRWLLRDGRKAMSPFGEEELAAMNPGRYLDVLDRPAGPVNPKVYVLSVRSAAGHPIALLANYWLHYVGGTGPGHVSADYFGIFAGKIGELLASPEQDPPFVGMLSNGASGDVNNNDYANYRKPGRKRYDRYEKMREVADDLAKEVARVEKTIAYRDWVPLGAAAEPVTLKRRKPTAAQVGAARKLLEESSPDALKDRDFARRATFARRAIEASDWPETADAFTQVLRLGDLGMAALPFEVFVEVGFEIQEKSPFEETFVMALANGGLGYLPSPRQHELGGYETWLTVAHAEKEASTKLVRKLTDLFHQVRPDRPASAGKTEPTNAEEVAAKKAEATARIDAAYAALVAELPPAEKAWEEVLQSELGNFYLPIHKKQKVEGRSNAWDFVRDDPALPRVLLIGDSVSRGYTGAVRRELKGEANVHRAPANCGPTATGLKKLDIWLGDGRWDIIHFNFGIHDRKTPPGDYRQRLDQIATRLKASGARVIWASTTPVPPDWKEGPEIAGAIVERNTIAAEVMKRYDIAIDDLFTFITPHLAETQNPADVHFNARGYDLLGGEVAKSIRLWIR